MHRELAQHVGVFKWVNVVSPFIWALKRKWHITLCVLIADQAILSLFNLVFWGLVTSQSKATNLNPCFYETCDRIELSQWRKHSRMMWTGDNLNYKEKQQQWCFIHIYVSLIKRLWLHSFLFYVITGWKAEEGLARVNSDPWIQRYKHTHLWSSSSLEGDLVSQELLCLSLKAWLYRLYIWSY